MGQKGLDVKAHRERQLGSDVALVNDVSGEEGAGPVGP
jgi:hypothetical protein